MAKNETKKKSVIVIATNEGAKNIQQLAVTLADKGLNIKRILPITGVISGSYSAKLSNLKNVAGVKAVEEELNAQF